MTNHDESPKQTVFKEEGEDTDVNVDENKTSTGIEQNLSGVLCYVFGFITGFIFLVVEKENRFVRFHALQSVFFSVAIIFISILLSIVPFIGWMISLLLTPLIFTLWIFLMYKAYKGEWFKLPFAGDLAEKQLNKEEA